MALSAADIGEKVHRGQRILGHYEVDRGGGTWEPETVTDLLVDLLHWATANGYDPKALFEEAERRRRIDIEGPVTV